MVSVACARPAGKDSTAIWRPLARLPRTALCAGRTRALVRHLDAPMAQVDFSRRIRIRIDAHYTSEFQLGSHPAALRSQGCN